MTDEEKRLLSKLAAGMLDGMVGEERVYRGYRNVYCGMYIHGGIPYSYREGEPTKTFDGKENTRCAGKRTEEAYSTDEEKLLFLQKYGFLIDDDDVRAYSAKYKRKK